MLIPSRTQALGQSPSQDLRKNVFIISTHWSPINSWLLWVVDDHWSLTYWSLIFISFLCLPFTRRFEGWFESLVCCYPHTTLICTTQQHQTHLPGQVVEGVVPAAAQQPPSLPPAGCPENPSPSTSTPNILLVQTPT